MKNKAKRIVSAICALAMCAAMLPAAAFAEGNTSEAAETPSTMSIFDWLKDRTVEVGDSIQIEGSASILGLDVHSWKVCDGDSDCVTLSNTGDRTVTVTGVGEGVVVLRHVITGVRTEYVKICVQAGSTTPNPDPDPVEGEGIYFYVAMPNNEVLSSDASDYRFLTYGGAASDLASHDMEAVTNTADERAVTQYIDTFPTDLNVGYPESINYPTSPKLDGENNSWTIDPETGEVSDFSFTIGTTTYTDEAYGLRWAKFSYAYTTDVVENAYHADAQLYEKITIESVLDDLNPEKVVTDFVLNTNGTELGQDTFAFVLSDSTGSTVADLTATVTEENVETKIELAADAASTTVLTPGEYTITETQDDLNAWEEADSITFTVASDGSVTVNNGSDKVITNTPATYTVEYNDGVDGEEITVPESSNHKYNEHTAVNDSTPARDGYTFQGWDADNNDTVDYEAGASIIITDNVTLTAIWKAEEATDPDVEPPETDPITPNPDEEDGVTVDKTATGLVDDKSNVTLTVGGGEETTASDVVFVLDKSASSEIRQEAMDMLTELQKQAGEGNIINVGVVNFEKGVLEQLELTALNDENYAAIEEAMIFHDVTSSGTNIYAGLVAGEAMLDADTTVDDANKHLVLVTDGVGYLWGSGDGNNVFSIYSESTSNGEENLYASHETIDWHHSSTSYYDEFKDMLEWYNVNSDSIADDMDQYQVTYEEGQYKAKDYGVISNQGEDTDWSVIEKFKAENSYVPAELENETASAPDAAIYMVAREWIKIAEKYNAYAYADPRYAKSGDYLWAYNAISNLGDLGDASYTLPENAADYDGMFDAVKSTVLYDIAEGTVTDVIGSNFDVASLDSFVLTVGGTEMKGTVNGNTVTFDNGNYVVTYQPGENEQFTWEIKVPVEDGAAVQLTYTVKLVNKATAPGDYTVPTNEEATLDYTSTTGGSGTETFPVPTVDYNIPPETVTVPSTPTPDEHPDIAEGIANGTWGGTPTPTPTAQTTAIPQTSDDLPLGLLIVVAIAAAGAVCGLVVLRKRSKQ